jgi:hypothetical protein
MNNIMENNAYAKVHMSIQTMFAYLSQLNAHLELIGMLSNLLANALSKDNI